MLCALTGDTWWWCYISGTGPAGHCFAYTNFSEAQQAVCPGSKQPQNEEGNNRWAWSSKFGTRGVGVPRLTQMWACHRLRVRALWRVAELFLPLTIRWQCDSSAPCKKTAVPQDSLASRGVLGACTLRASDALSLGHRDLACRETSWITSLAIFFTNCHLNLPPHNRVVSKGNLFRDRSVEQIYDFHQVYCAF